MGAKAAYLRAWKLRTNFGMTEDDYQRMLAEQGGVCCLCGRTNHNRALCIDHCHDTGRIRGLLCARCNVALATLGDNPDGLRRALEYVEGPDV